MRTHRRLAAVLAALTLAAPAVSPAVAHAADEEPALYTAGNDRSATLLAWLHKLDDAGQPVWKFGQGRPISDLDVDADGYTYAAVNGLAAKVDPDGGQVWVYDSGARSWVRRVAVGPEGSVYVASANIHRRCALAKVDHTGREVWATDDVGCTVHDIAVDAAGNAYLATSAGAEKYRPDGTRVWRYTGHAASVRGVAVHASGSVYTAGQDGKVHKLDADGHRAWAYTAVVRGGPDTDVAVDADGFVVAVANSKVHKLNPDGTVVWARSPAQFLYLAFELVLDERGHIYLASEGAGNGNLHHVDPEGNLVWAREVHPGGIRGVAVEPGAFAVAGHGGPRELAFDVSGKTHVKAANGTLALSGGLDARWDRQSGKLESDLELEPATGEFTALRFLPVRATVDFEQAAKPTGTLGGSEFDVHAKLHAYLKAASLFGFPIGGGANCRTVQPFAADLHGDAFDPDTGGELTAMYALPGLQNCGTFTDLLSTMVAGPGNTMDLRLTT